MAIETVLNKILNFGKEENYFQFTTIEKLDKSCCLSSEIEVIDFDETEIKHRELGFNSMKSCDALKILVEDERIDFIEMKSTKNILKNRELNSKQNLSKQIGKFDFESKIRDSLSILSNIIILKNSPLTGSERKIYHQTIKQPILLTDIDYKDNALDFLVLTLDYLGNFSGDIKTLMQNEVNKVKPDTLNNLMQPLLMDCKKFEEHYK